MANSRHMAKLQHGAFCKLFALATYRVEQMALFQPAQRENAYNTATLVNNLGPGWD